MSVAAFEKEITEMLQKSDAHSNMVSKLDEAFNELEMMDGKLTDLTSRVLTGVMAHYERDSNEYEMAGGVRHSERNYRKTKLAEEATALEGCDFFKLEQFVFVLPWIYLKWMIFHALLFSGLREWIELY